MPIMNFTELKDARTLRFLHKYSGGMGLAAFQFVLGAVVALVITAVFGVISLVFHGIILYGAGIGLACGILAARETNSINTKHKLPQRYFQGEVRKRLNRTRPLILDDQRFPYPSAKTENYVVRVAEFPPTTQEDDHDT
jgi:hypothetical protein